MVDSDIYREILLMTEEATQQHKKSKRNNSTQESSTHVENKNYPTEKFKKSSLLFSISLPLFPGFVEETEQSKTNKSTLGYFRVRLCFELMPMVVDHILVIPDSVLTISSFYFLDNLCSWYYLYLDYNVFALIIHYWLHHKFGKWYMFY